jgi:hypothetical protein
VSNTAQLSLDSIDPFESFSRRTFDQIARCRIAYGESKNGAPNDEIYFVFDLDDFVFANLSGFVFFGWTEQDHPELHAERR